MKKIGISLMVLLFFSQCRDLSVEHKGIEFSEEVIQDLESGQLALNGCYRVWRGEFRGAVDDEIFRVELPGFYTRDLDPRNFGGTDYNEFFNRDISSDNEVNAEFWGHLYQVINATNKVINDVGALAVQSGEEQEQQRIIAEARFLRALQYTYLVQFYGDVPLRLEFTDHYENLALAASPIEEIYGQVEEDLVYASSHLHTHQLHYASKEASQVMLARVFLYQEDWQNALDAAESVIQTEKFALSENFSSIFIQPGGQEGIFYTSYDPGFNRLYLAFRDQFFTVGVDLNSLYQQEDLRRDITFNGSRITKYVDNQNNDPIYDIRYAEVLLIAAEAAGEVGDFNKTNAYYEMIRERADLSAPTLDATNFKDSLLTERWRELYAEGPNRFMDVKRMGKAQEYWDIPEYKELWPIPQQELDENPLLNQNPGY